MTETFTPAQAAKELETDSSTIRRWCGWHSEHLSDGASPAPGGRRLLTAHDMEVLRTVKALRIAGLTTPAINEQLAGRTFAVVDSTESPQDAPDGPGHELAPIVAQYDIAALSALVTSRIDAIERSQAQAQRTQRHWLVAFALGAIFSAVLILLIVLLVMYAR